MVASSVDQRAVESIIVLGVEQAGWPSNTVRWEVKSKQPPPPAVEMATWGWLQSLKAVLDCVCNVLLGFEALFLMFPSGKLEEKAARKEAGQVCCCSPLLGHDWCLGTRFSG